MKLVYKEIKKHNFNFYNYLTESPYLRRIVNDPIIIDVIFNLTRLKISNK